MNDRQKKILELQAELDLLEYITDFVDNYKKYDLQYHNNRLKDDDITEYDREYNENEITKYEYQKEYLKHFTSKI